MFHIKIQITQYQSQSIRPTLPTLYMEWTLEDYYSVRLIKDACTNRHLQKAYSIATYQAQLTAIGQQFYSEVCHS